MPQDFREVVIRLDYDSRTAEIWCAKRTVERKLARLGYERTRTDAHGVWYRAPLKAISFRRPASIGAKRRNPATPPRPTAPTT